jgi:phosphoribosylamine--glycine ligase
MSQIKQFVLDPFVNGLRSENIPFRGVIYAGLMLTETGPKVLEFNCRFGDPETQVVLPLLKSDLYTVLRSVAHKKLSSIDNLDWRDGYAACVVMTSKGYPAAYEKGKPINGLRRSWGDSVEVFHAGTRRKGNNFATAGGRVLGVVGLGDNLKSALDKSYETVGQIEFEGATYRRDIGFRVLSQQQ